MRRKDEQTQKNAVPSVISVVSNPFYDFVKELNSEKVGDMGYHKDVADREEIKVASNSAVDTLKASEERYRRLFETAQDGILIIDADTGRIADVNPFLADMLGYVREDFVGKSLWSFGPFRDIRASKSAFQELISDGYIRYEHLPLETRSGQRIEVEFISNVYPVGKKRTIQCNIRDNSQRKHAEKASLIIESQLKQAQKMAAVSTLAGGIAHQFNNALTVITGGLDLLEENGCTRDPGGYVELMKRATGQMTRIIRELLAYARGGKYNIEKMSLSDLVRDSLPLIKSVLKPSITIETELPSGLPEIYADRSQMQMALLAILSNASEAIDTQGRIRIICRKDAMNDESVKAFSGLVPGTYTSLTVEDNGKGMNEETCSRVFEPFFTTHFHGRGLGMAAVYGTVKNHDGWISVKSQVDAGTVVCIYLPAADAKLEITRQSPLPIQKAQQGSSF